MAAPAPATTAPARNAANTPVADIDNTSLIIRLYMTVNHLSRWLTPIHDQRRLAYRSQRDFPSVKDLLIALRNTELVRYQQLHAIAYEDNPNLDLLIDPVADHQRRNGEDANLSPLSVLGEFRRLRNSSCAILRSLPDNAWGRIGTSRNEHDWQVRTLAESLAEHDSVVLSLMDETLSRSGAREGIADYAKTPYRELLALVPVTG